MKSVRSPMSFLSSPGMSADSAEATDTYDQSLCDCDPFEMSGAMSLVHMHRTCHRTKAMESQTKPAFKTWHQSNFLEKETYDPGGVTTWDGFKSHKEVKDDLFVCVWFVRCSLLEVSCHFGIPIRCDGFIFGCFCCIFGSCIFVRCSQETILGPGNSPEVMFVGTVHDTQRPSKSSRILTYLNPHPQTRPTLNNAHKHT